MLRFKKRIASILRTGSLILSCAVLAVTSVPMSVDTTYAQNIANCDSGFFSGNDILFYDPCGASCYISSAPSSTSSGDLSKVVDYENKDIFTDADIQAIKENKPFYEKAAEKEQIPWEMIAVTHYRESRLKRINPSNGQGIYQDYERYGGPYPTGPVDDAEFQRQTDWVAIFLKGKAGDKASLLAQNDDNAVKYAFFGYNGRAGVYITQAKSLGFNDEEASNGEGSPYVMNKADEKRDPNKNPLGWGQIKTDGGSISYPANQDHGAFVMYAALRGKISANCSDQTLGQGGLTEEQAKIFMMKYGENVGNDSVNSMNAGAGRPGTGCAGGALSNCVSFSAFFMNKFTNMKYQGGNGNDVVRNLESIGVPTGNEPKVFAVFSNGFHTSAGHTGVILGIHGDTLVVGHASCSNPGSGRGDGTQEGGGAGYVITGTISARALVYTDTPTFAYPTEVDNAAIEAYINQ